MKNRRKDKRIIKKINTPIYRKRACLSASATVEAALVIPIFIYAVLAIAYMVQILSIRSNVMRALYADAQKLEGYSYAYVETQSQNGKKCDLEKEEGLDGALKNGITLVTAKSLLISELGQDYAYNCGIVGGNMGLFMEGSSLLQGDNGLTLKVRYVVKNPYDLLGIGMITVEQQCKTNAWLGEDYVKSRDDNDNQDETVYITEHGSVYHKDRSCTYLQHVIQEVDINSLSTLRNLSGGKYYLCEKCGKEMTGHIYVTGYGNRYHSSKNCSILNRTILTVPKSSVPDRSPCSKCCGGN